MKKTWGTSALNVMSSTLTFGKRAGRGWNEKQTVEYCFVGASPGFSWLTVDEYHNKTIASRPSVCLSASLSVTVSLWDSFNCKPDSWTNFFRRFDVLIFLLFLLLLLPLRLLDEREELVERCRQFRSLQLVLELHSKLQTINKLEKT